MTVYGPGAPKYGKEGRPVRQRVRKKPKRTVRSVKKSCDVLWSKVVRTRAGGACERCGTVPDDSRGFHAHHVYGRNNHRLRFEPRNGVATCARCHRWGHNNPVEFSEWFRRVRLEDYFWLRGEYRKGSQPPRSLAIYLELESKLSNLLTND